MTPNYTDPMKSIVISFISILAMLPIPATAQTVAVDAAKVSWVNATQLVDGTPIPASGPTAIAQTRVQRSVIAGCNTAVFGTVAQTVNVPITDSSAQFDGLRPAGLHCFRVAHVQVNGEVSAWSGVVTKTIVVSTKTKPPTVTIQ